MTMKILSAFSILLLSSCAGMQATELSPAGREVALITSIGPSDLEKYSEISPEGCHAGGGWNYETEESCKDKMRNEAAAKGAAFVMIESIDRRKCEFEEKQTCIVLTGRSYKKKTAAAKAN